MDTRALAEEFLGHFPNYIAWDEWRVPPHSYTMLKAKLAKRPSAIPAATCSNRSPPEVRRGTEAASGRGCLYDTCQ